MEGKLLNHVEFKFIRNAYPLHEKLFCYIQTPVLSQWQPEIGDWVGLYKVGWSQLKDHKIRKQIRQEWLENGKNVNVDYIHVTFEQHELPKDIEGLYQFVYVTKMEVVKGVSTPFRFERGLPQVELKRFVDVIGKQQQPQQQQTIQQQIQQQVQQQVQQKLQRQFREQEQEQILSRVGLDKLQGKQMMQELEETAAKWLLQDNEITSIQQQQPELKRGNSFYGELETPIVDGTIIKLVHRVNEEPKRCNEETINQTLNKKRSQMVEKLLREVDGTPNQVRLLKRVIEDLKNDNELLRERVRQVESEKVVSLYRQHQQKQQQELKGENGLYGELETPIVECTRVKVAQRYAEEPMSGLTQQTNEKKRTHLMEKLLREVEGTPCQVKLLKRLIEDLKIDSELLRERVNQAEGEIQLPSYVRQQQQQLPVKQSINVKEVTVCPRINLVQMNELIDEQRNHHHHQSMIETTQLPSITVSTMLPEQQPQKTITITGKVEQPKVWQQCPQQPQWQSIECQRPYWQQQQQVVEEEQQQQWKPLRQVEQQEQQQLRGQVGEYLNRLDDQIRSKIEERLRNKLQEQLQGKIEQQQQQQQPRSSLYRLEEFVKQQKQQQQQWQSINEQPRQWSSIQQQQQQLDEQIRQLCPVCGIAMPTELNVCDFEIHVNSHFTD